MKDLRKVRKWHCFFEQSGTFKNEFKKLGLDAVDYDILDDFGQTDFKADLFEQIEAAYEGGESLFDGIGEGEAIFAFFPCIRFCPDGLMRMRGDAWDMRNKSQLWKLENALEVHTQLSRFYSLITKMAIVCMRKDIPLVIENPSSSQHYLTKYWPAKAQIVDENRRESGDYYSKPTQFWFINCEPLNNVILDEAIAYHPKAKIQETHGTARSMISPDYARRFIRTYLKEYDAGDAS